MPAIPVNPPVPTPEPSIGERLTALERGLSQLVQHETTERATIWKELQRLQEELRKVYRRLEKLEGAPKPTLGNGVSE